MVKKTILTLSATTLFSLSAMANQQCTVRGIVHTLDTAEQTLPCPFPAEKSIEKLTEQDREDIRHCFRKAGNGDFETGKQQQLHLGAHNDYLARLKVAIMENFKNAMFSDETYPFDKLLAALREGLEISGGVAIINSDDNTLNVMVNSKLSLRDHPVVTGFPEQLLPK